MTLIDNWISQDTYDNRLKKCLAYNARLMNPNMKTLMDVPIDQVGDCKEITVKPITWATRFFPSPKYGHYRNPFS